MNKVQEALQTLKAYNAWRRDEGDTEPLEMPEPKVIGEAVDVAISALSEIEKCEPVAEALHERNRLGYAVVDVIGTLDEIIENAQEVEVDDFLHIAITIDKWHELQDALEEMPKRAELYTSPISKEWVWLSDEAIKGLPQPNYDITTAQYVKLIEAKLKELNT